MKLFTFFVIAFATLFFHANPVLADVATADIQATQDGSDLNGQAILTDTNKGLTVQIEINAAPPGLHGIHIHAFGSCGDGGKAAGGHYNPAGTPHAFLPEQGLLAAHAGDLGNIEIDDTGSGSLNLTLYGLSLSGSGYSVGGRGVILHAKQDDFGQPTGNAGSRIGCGTIIVTGK